jgi:predicted metal-binding membrane protein
VLAAVLLVAVAAAAWVALALADLRAAATVRVDPPLTASVAPGTWRAADAVAALRSSLGGRGATDRLVRGRMEASRFDPALEIAPGERAKADLTWPAEAWLVTTADGRWWVWEYGATAPADAAALRFEEVWLATAGEEHGPVGAVRLLPAPAGAGPAEPPGPRRWLADATAGAAALGRTGTAVLSGAVATLGGWVLLLLAVVLPGATPVLAGYGAAHRRVFGTAHAAGHAALFALAVALVWLAAAATLDLGGLGVAVAAGARELAARLPAALAVAWAGAGLYQLSPLAEDCLAACRRPVLVGVAAGPDYRGTLRSGRAYGLRSVGAGGGVILAAAVAGAPVLLWAVPAAAVLLASQALPRGQRIRSAVGVALLALAVLAALHHEAPGAARGALAQPERIVGVGAAGELRSLWTPVGTTGG